MQIKPKDILLEDNIRLFILKIGMFILIQGLMRLTYDVLSNGIRYCLSALLGVITMQIYYFTFHTGHLHLKFVFFLQRLHTEKRYKMNSKDLDEFMLVCNHSHIVSTSVKGMKNISFTFLL